MFLTINSHPSIRFHHTLNILNQKPVSPLMNKSSKRTKHIKTENLNLISQSFYLSSTNVNPNYHTYTSMLNKNLSSTNGNPIIYNAQPINQLVLNPHYKEGVFPNWRIKRLPLGFRARYLMDHIHHNI